MQSIQEHFPLSTPQKLEIPSFSERKTEELVFALVEPIGGGSSLVVQELRRILESNSYNYIVNIIKVSDIILDIIQTKEPSMKLEELDFSIFNENKIVHPSDEAKRIYTLQQFGNKLREKYGKDYLAKCIISKIAKYRRDNNGFIQAGGASVKVPISLRVVHIIQSIKHDAELDLLKNLYGNIFFTIAITGSYNQRFMNFVPDTRISPEEEKKYQREFDLLTNIDQFDGEDFGQRVRKVFHQANLFLKYDDASIKFEINRFLKLLFNIEIYSPSNDERMMYTAFSSAMMSTCLSRQVGAAIANNKNELIGTGWNDIPCFGGGLASDIYQDQKSALCKTKGFCNSNKKIDELISEIFLKLKDDKILSQRNKNFKIFKKSILSTSISSLIEFSRAIHAEMEAILSAARNGQSSLRGASIYVTTYPCENCVKHILAAGISKIFYIEPYPKSRAKEFFEEFIVDEDENKDENGKNQENKLILKKFVGIAPNSFKLLFKATNRKDGSGKLLSNNAKPIPKTNVYLDSFAIYEQHIAKGVL